MLTRSEGIVVVVDAIRGIEAFVAWLQVAEVFYYAQKAILHPTAPLFDQESQTLKPRCVRALTRIFTLCDHDKDGILNDAELNDFQVSSDFPHLMSSIRFIVVSIHIVIHCKDIVGGCGYSRCVMNQVKCFNAPLQPSEVVGVKKVVSEKMAEGVNNDGLTLTGFLFLHALFIERGRLETTWTVLRKFGYDDEIKLRDDLVLNPSFKRAPDQVFRNDVFVSGISIYISTLVKYTGLGASGYFFHNFD